MRKYLVLLLFCVPLLSKGNISIDVSPTSWVPCPSTISGSCGFVYLGGVVQMDYLFHSVDNDFIRFRVRKCDQTNFGSSGTVYIKDGDVCGSIVNQVSYSAGVGEVSIDVPISYWVSGSRDFTITITSSTSDRFNAGTVNILKECPDFQVSNVQSAATVVYQGQYNVDVSCLIENIGNDSGNEDVDFYLSTNTTYSSNDLYIGRVGFNLAGGQSTTLVEDWDVAPTQSPGGYYVVAIADKDDVEEECQEWNNSSFTYVTVRASPDLEMGSITTSTPQICTNGDIELTYTLENNGDALSPVNTEVDFYLSTNGSYGSSDYHLGTDQTTLIFPNGSITRTINFQGIPLNPTDYYIIARIDADNDVIEQYENNNQYVTPYEIDILGTVQLFSPTDNSILSTLTPMLDWGSVSNANDYAVAVLENGTQVIGENTGSSTQYQVQTNELQAGLTYQWVAGAELSTGEICESDPWTFTTQCADNFEPNDDYLNPNTSAFTSFSTDETQSIQAFMASATDKDYYEINLTSSGSLEIDLTSLPDNYELELWPSDHSTVIASSTNTGTTNENISFQHTGGNSIFLVKVYTSSGFDCSDDYSLSLDWTPSSGGGGLELNQTITTNPSPIVHNQLGEFTYSILNNSSNSFSGIIRLELDDNMTGSPINVIEEIDPFFLNSNASFTHTFTTPSPVSTIEGDYFLRVSYSDDNGATWNPVGNGVYVHPQPFKIVHNPIRLNSTFTVTPANIHQGDTAEFSVEVINFGNEVFSDTISLNWLDENFALITPLTKGVYTLSPGQSQTIAFFTPSIQSNPADYYLRVDAFFNSEWHPTFEGNHSQPHAVTVLPPNAGIEITNPNASSSFTSGDNLPIDWTITGTIDVVSIELRDVSNNYIETIADNISSAPGSLTSYDLPNCLSTGNYRIKMYETGTGLYESYSTDFSVTRDVNCTCSIDIPSVANGDEVELVEAANYLCSLNIIDDASNVRPYEPINRGELAKMVFRSLFGGNPSNIPTDNFSSPFLDLQSNNDWFYRSAKALSYLQYNDGATPFDRNAEFRFRPYDGITRKYVTKVILEAFDITEDPIIPNPYVDVSATTDAYSHIVSAADLCIISTVSDSFRPHDLAQRGEVMIMLYRLLETCASGTYTTPTPAIDDYFCPGNQTPANMSRGIGLEEGNFNHYSQTSFALPGVGLPLIFGHEYNSYLTDLPDDFFPLRPLGHGWTHTYNSYVLDVPVWNEALLDVEHKLILFFPGGQIQVWDNPQSGYPYSCTAETNGVYETLTVESATVIKVRTKSQVAYTYTRMSVGDNKEAFLITQIKDRNDHEINIAYENGNGAGSPQRIKTVARELGNAKTSERTLHFNYQSGTNYISQVYLNISGLGGTSISYDVNSNGDLRTYTDRMGAHVTYNYIQDNGSPSDDDINKFKHLLLSIDLPKGNTITNKYTKRKLSQSNVNNKLVTNISTNFNYTDLNTGVEGDVNTFDTDLGYNTYEKHVEFDDENEGKPKCVTVNGDVQCITYADTDHPYHPTKIEDTNSGLSIELAYDDDANLTTREIYFGNTLKYKWTYAYNQFNDLTGIIDPSLNTVAIDMGVDPSRGLVHSVTDQEGFITQYGYFNASDGQWKNGAIKHIISPENIQVDYNYDLYGNQSEINAPDDISSSSTFDGLARVTTAITPNNHTYEYTYYDNDLPHVVTNPLDHTVEYGYDDNYNLKSVKNERGYTTHLNYNFDTDLLESTTFEGSTIQYEHHNDGRIEKITKPDGTVVNIRYRDQGPGLGQVEDDGFATYTYDDENRLKTVTKDNNGVNHVITYHYDPLNRMTSYDYDAGAYSYTVGYEYDDNGNIAKVRYPNLNGSGTLDVEYRYFKNNWIKEVEDWEGKVTAFFYHDEGAVDYMTLPNGVTCTYAYDPLTRRMVGKTELTSNNDTIVSYSYVLDDVGNIVSESRTEPFADVAMQSLVRTAVYGSNNFIESSDGVSYSVNVNGNLESDGTNTYTWDNAYDVLQSVNSVQHIYDGLGMRRERLDNGQVNRYIWDVMGMGNVIAEMDGSGNPTAYYIYAGSSLLCRKADAGSNYDDGYYHSNFQGSTIAMTDEAQNITHKYAYDSYGSVIIKDEADYNPFTFVGKYGVMGEDDHFYYMRARFYDAKHGRFISTDPIWSTNLMGYGGGNPQMSIDPTGEVSSEPSPNTNITLGINRIVPWYRECTHTVQSLKFGTDWRDHPKNWPSHAKAKGYETSTIARKFDIVTWKNDLTGHTGVVLGHDSDAHPIYLASNEKGRNEDEIYINRVETWTNKPGSGTLNEYISYRPDIFNWEFYWINQEDLVIDPSIRELPGEFNMSYNIISCDPSNFQCR